MKIDLENWFLGQCGREDSVGELSRRWLNEAAGGKIRDGEKWLTDLGSTVDWATVVLQAKKEFAHAVNCLERGQSAPTFPKLFASESYNQHLHCWFKKHKAQPELSADAYLRQKHFGLQKAIEGRRLIYLDTNHWINLRHVILASRLVQKEYVGSLALLMDLARKGHVLCPISYPLFLELMKQTDLRTRTATAELMEGLSGGVCLQPPFELQKLELRQQLMKGLLGIEAPNLNEWIWTRVGYLGGEYLPLSNAFSDADNNLIRKVCIDQTWDISLPDFVDFLDDFTDEPERLIAAATNQDAAWYRGARLPFPRVLEREKAYLIRRLMDCMRQIIQELWNDYPDQHDVSKLPPVEDGKFDPWATPSIQVLAGVHAALIVSGKKFSANDILDFEHAALAIPYCDALFCDGPMAQTPQNKPLEFGRIYDTAILSNPVEILNYLRSLN